MPIANLAALRDAVAEHIERVGDPALLEVFPMFVLSIEQQINEEIYGLADDGESFVNTIQPLQSDTDSNFVLISFSNIYFFGCIVEAYGADLVSAEKASVAEQRFRNSLDFLKRARRSKKLKSAKPGGVTP